MKVQKHRFLLVCLTAFSFVSLTNVQASVVELLPVADTYIRDLAPDLNFGSDSILNVGVAKVHSPQNRGLVKFDLTGIPTNATILSATFTVVIFREGTGPADYNLNRMLVDWDEYQATWNSRFDTIPWHLGGCQKDTDYVFAPSVTAEIGGTTFSSAGMVSDVQLWLTHPETNFGWIIIAVGDVDGISDDDVDGTGKQLDSRDSEHPPTLTIVYTLTPPPVATPPIIFGMSQVANTFRFSFNAESNRTYAVEFCDSLTATNWSLLTTIPSDSTNRTVCLTNSISSAERYFRTRTP